MFAPKPFEMNNLAAKQQFIDKFGFGVLVSNGADDPKDNLQASHLPFLLKSNEGKYGTLYSHCAKANPQLKVLNNAKVLITFSGPHSYISPTWYQGTPAVPTWNYAAVHVHGCVQVTNREMTLQAITDLVKKYEPSLLEEQDIIPKTFVEKLLSGIAGLKIKIQRIDGVQKLGQQRSHADQVGVYQALSRSQNFDNLALANYMSIHEVGVETP